MFLLNTVFMMFLSQLVQDFFYRQYLCIWHWSVRTVSVGLTEETAPFTTKLDLTDIKSALEPATKALADFFWWWIFYPRNIWMVQRMYNVRIWTSNESRDIYTHTSLCKSANTQLEFGSNLQLFLENTSHEETKHHTFQCRCFCALSNCH